MLVSKARGLLCCFVYTGDKDFNVLNIVNIIRRAASCLLIDAGCDSSRIQHVFQPFTVFMPYPKEFIAISTGAIRNARAARGTLYGGGVLFRHLTGPIPNMLERNRISSIWNSLQEICKSNTAEIPGLDKNMFRG